MSFNQENYNSYKETQLEKQKIKSKIQNSDPILQSNKYYEQKEKKLPIETRNYFFKYISNLFVYKSIEKNQLSTRQSFK